MKKMMILLVVLSAALLLAACSSGTTETIDGVADPVATTDSGTDPVAATESGAGSSTVNAVDIADDTVDSAEAEAVSEPVQLTEEFADALSLDVQLAVGTLQLEESALALDDEQAADLLPLWRAVQSLSNSDTAAAAEVQAVLNQIQNRMSADQVAAIANMQLTQARLEAMQQSGELNIGGAGGFGRGGADAGDGVVTERGGGGGLGGGGRGGPGGGGGLGGGALGGDINEDDIATRQAQFAEDGVGAFLGRAMTNAVVRLLETRTGDLSDGAIQANIMSEAYAAVSQETGLDVNEIRQQLGEGQSMAEIIEANGGDVAALKVRLADLFGGLPNAGELDLAQAVDEWLGLATSE